MSKQEQSQSSESAKEAVAPIDLDFEIEEIEREINQSVRQETQKQMSSEIQDATDGSSENVAVIDMLKD